VPAHSQSEASAFLREVVASAVLAGIIFLALVLLPSHHFAAPGHDPAIAGMAVHLHPMRDITTARHITGEILEARDLDVRDDAPDMSIANSRTTASPSPPDDSDEC
jgi:hypothetical protein